MKNKIVNKAAEMFLNLGFKSVTMDDLAHEMGISKKTIYSHFENKTKLVLESTMHIFEQVSKGIEAICALEKNPIEEIYEIKKFMMLHLKDEKSAPQHQLQKYYPQIFETLRDKQYEVTKDCVVENLTKGMELGIYRENLDIKFVSRIYFSGVMSIKNNDIFPQTIFPMTTLMDSFLEYHIRGIVNPKGREILNKIINSNQE